VVTGSATLEQRVEAIEAELSEMREKLPAMQSSEPWWRFVGAFKDDPDFGEAVRLGREYRLSVQDEYDE
jgi:hypothetical protein